MAVKKSKNEEQYDNQVRWYIIQTYVGFEDAVNKALDLKIESLSLESRIVEIFIPTKKVIKLNNKGERQEKIERIYPGYIYLKMLLDKDIGYIIQNTNYVSRITGTGDFAVPLEEGYVEKLKEDLLKQSEDGQITTSVTFKLGDLVTVIDGPFKDMQGKVSGMDPHNGTIDVLLTMFERETLVTLDGLVLKKAV
jgi:transcriptional antiterminator NusG